MDTKPPKPKPAPPPRQAREPKADFADLLESFGGRAARLCDLYASGRMNADRCFVALTQLWLQLAGAHQRSTGADDHSDDHAGPAPLAHDTGSENTQ